ncbi:hypothetical protein HYPSUDRAFT_999361 [Hypholoma sublateritium FD-334 SS-4]|uniref:Uncharacterized protein n=1 Tax=Hypholoma sublateritium (strain FD-334 SS-4) TaxID=945553 RepID=A0A0D2PC47_HYPSF|nr:hypothetical protein HYPSUDRAFT_999361 [Hypholoma sublateritium FD-334 SS-4]
MGTSLKTASLSAQRQFIRRVPSSTRSLQCHFARSSDIQLISDPPYLRKNSLPKVEDFMNAPQRELFNSCLSHKTSVAYSMWLNVMVDGRK